MCTFNDESHFVVLDLEMCRVSGQENRYRYKMEIIQMGAVLLDQKFNIISRFDKYVKPCFGSLDSFISRLTGITFRDIANAPELEQILQEFMIWMPQGARVVSWSMTDRKQLFNEINEKKLRIDGMDDLYAGWIDCQLMFGEKMNMNRCYSLEEALIAADIFSEGKPHNALTDANNTALLFAKMNMEEDFKLNPYYKNAHVDEADKPLSCPIGDILDGKIFLPFLP